LLEICGVSKRYGRVDALSDLTFRLGPGVTGLLGPNGAGKSTLMRILATVTPPSSGRVRWCGTDVAGDPDAVRRELGYLPQDFGVYANLNAVEFLRYLASLKGLAGAAGRARVDEVIEAVGLREAARRALGGFSGGMRQRVGIAQALLNDPRLLIVDEPTVGLDPGERIRFRELLAGLAGARVVLLSTHIVSDVEATAGALVILAGGRLLAQGSPGSLLGPLEGRVWTATVAHDQVALLRERHVVSGTMRRPDGVQLRIVSTGPPVAQARPATATLEDAYLHTLAGVGASA
jgi:ABC-type multidrug transport system ATPase subunit